MAIQKDTIDCNLSSKTGDNESTSQLKFKIFTKILSIFIRKTAQIASYFTSVEIYR